MAYAVTCRSCGARFSVEEELVRKKLSGKTTILRCKHCQAAIRVGAADIPSRLSSRPPPSPEKRKPVPPGLTRPKKPRPPLKTRPGLGAPLVPHISASPEPPPPPPAPEPDDAATATPVPASATETPLPVTRPRPATASALARDLFEAPARADDVPVDLSDMAESVPPGPPSDEGSEPALEELLTPRQPRPRADAEFLLGLSGSRGANGAIEPPLLDAEDETALTQPLPNVAAKAEPEAPGPETQRGSALSENAPRNSSVPSQAFARTSAPKRKPRVSPVLLLLLGGTALAATVGVSLTRGGDEEPPAVALNRDSSPENAAVAPAPIETPEPVPVSATPMPEASQVVEPPPAAVAAPTPTPRTRELAEKPTTNAIAHHESATRSENAASAERSSQVTSAKSSAAETEPTPRAEAAVVPAPAAPRPAPAPAQPGQTFDVSAASAALTSAAAEAASCRKPGDPTGVAVVTVTFAPSGRVTSATVSGPPFAGTQTGGCIASTLRRAQVPAFEGDKISVGKTIVIK